MALPLAQVVDCVASSLLPKTARPRARSPRTRVHPVSCLARRPPRATHQAVAVPGTRVPHPVEDVETKLVGPTYGAGTQVISRSSTLSCALGPETPRHRSATKRHGQDGARPPFQLHIASLPCQPPIGGFEHYSELRCTRRTHGTVPDSFRPHGRRQRSRRSPGCRSRSRGC